MHSDTLNRLNHFKKGRKKMEINELKRELSKLSGVDFFNPKYRELFKKAFPDAGSSDSDDVVKADTDTDTEESKIEAKTEDIDKAEDEREIDKIEREKATSAAEKADKAEDEREETREIGKDTDDLKTDKTNDLLLEAKIENALLRGGIREDKLGYAMRLAKSEIGSMEDLDKVKDILSDFPEWVRGD